MLFGLMSKLAFHNRSRQKTIRITFVLVLLLCFSALYCFLVFLKQLQLCGILLQLQKKKKLDCLLFVRLLSIINLNGYELLTMVPSLNSMIPQKPFIKPSCSWVPNSFSMKRTMVFSRRKECSSRQVNKSCRFHLVLSPIQRNRIHQLAHVLFGRLAYSRYFETKNARVNIG